MLVRVIFLVKLWRQRVLRKRKTKIPDSGTELESRQNIFSVVGARKSNFRYCARLRVCEHRSLGGRRIWCVCRLWYPGIGPKLIFGSCTAVIDASWGHSVDLYRLVMAWVRASIFRNGCRRPRGLDLSTNLSSPARKVLSSRWWKSDYLFSYPAGSVLPGPGKLATCLVPRPQIWRKNRQNGLSGPFPSFLATCDPLDPFFLYSLVWKVI